jgi:hypothetical protein
MKTVIIYMLCPRHPGAIAVNDQPFNAALCQAGPCARSSRELLQPLRAATRRCPHGVLISTGCLLRAPRCEAGPGHESGAYLLVQPCDRNRQPRGIAISVGPVLTRADAAAVAAWLADGLDAESLDPRLRVAVGPTAAERNGWPGRSSR